MLPLPKTVRIGKDTWRIVATKCDVLGENYGACLHDEKTIYVFDKPEHDDPVLLLATIAHEIIHARNKGLSEKATSETEAAIMEAARAILYD